MPTYPNVPLVAPTVGGSSGAWGTLLNAIFQALDNHRHDGTGSGGLKITSSGIDIDEDLTVAGYGLTNIGKLAFSAVTALASGSKSLFVSSADNELYWRTNSGSNVKLTSGTSLNVSAFTGGIGGDYTAVSAAFNYDDSNVRYTAKAGGGTTWARIASGELRIYETSSSESVYVGVAAPSALASSYTITLPTAAPGSDAIVQMTSAGVLSASNTIANAVTLQGSLATQGARTVGGIISPGTALAAGNNNDYNPTGFSTCSVMRVTADATAVLTGLTAGQSGRTVILINVGTPDLTITHDDAASTAANRFYLPNGASMVVRDNGAVRFWYDDTSSRWRPIGASL